MVSRLARDAGEDTMEGMDASVEAPLEALRATPKTPEIIGEDPDLETLLRDSTGRRLRCRVCRAVVTTEGHRIEVEGGHVHRRVNPAGFEFEFGCFDAAPGAVVLGEPTAEFSWFAGYTWEYAICRTCKAHLGWFFDGASPRFYALILNRLEVEEQTEEPS